MRMSGRDEDSSAGASSRDITSYIIQEQKYVTCHHPSPPAINMYNTPLTILAPALKVPYRSPRKCKDRLGIHINTETVFT